MANNYSEGTGTLYFSSEPALSPLAAHLLALIESTPVQNNMSLFFCPEGQWIDEDHFYDHLGELLPDGVLPPEDKDVGKLIDLLGEHGIEISDGFRNALVAWTEGDGSLDIVKAVLSDERSNLIAFSYSEAYYCSKLRHGEQGGWGTFQSRHVEQFVNSHQLDAIELDRLIEQGDNKTILNKMLNVVTDCFAMVKDVDLRRQLSGDLLQAWAAQSVVYSVDHTPVDENADA